MMDIEKMTLREVADATREMPMAQGGLRYMIEKIIMEIEKLQERNHNRDAD
jgi:hypothetical protein